MTALSAPEKGICPQLTAQQEHKLAMACAQGDEEAIRTMVSANLPLVASIAKKYAGKGVPMMDLIQEGSIGLIAAARKFDYTRNNRFSTYATKCIRLSIVDCVINYNGIIRVPNYTAERMHKVLQARTELMQRDGKEPDAQAIAQFLQMEPQKVQKLLELCPQVLSLDTPVGPDGEDGLQALIQDLHAPQPQEELIRQELIHTVDTLLSMLTQRQQQVLRLHFGMEDGSCHSLEEIGKMLGISKERTRQIEQQAMDKLRIIGADFGLEDFLQ